ncbi:transmembrane protein 176B-like [Eublepharis macularius]|uniref:Transmembrane protein 176B-like n=1 Tax=Eublepharis macularius TaxID=481883 RepID=A0AA97IWH0_EUBMA|nr:transmembrane protein 176B-like [Eublepharis macularius]
MATSVTECGNVRIITQVIQQKHSKVAEVTSESGSTSNLSQLTSIQPQNFTNALPKALGVVQIFLGVVQISFGIALTVGQEDLKKLTVNSGVYFWIGILLLLSGALLVEMEKRDHALLGEVCLYLNLVVGVAAVVAVILHGTEIGKEASKGDPCTGFEHYHCSSSGQVLVYGLNSVFIIISLLELAISLTAAVVAFRSRRQQSYRQMASK